MKIVHNDPFRMAGHIDCAYCRALCAASVTMVDFEDGRHSGYAVVHQGCLQEYLDECIRVCLTEGCQPDDPEFYIGMAKLYRMRTGVAPMSRGHGSGYVAVPP